jgi:long-chain fatty acid transport protein
MKQMNLKVIPALLLATFSGASMAAGFAIQAQNGSGNGNAFAGAAASAEDAGTVFFNPAGMAYLPQGHNISVGGTYLDRSIKFNNTGTGGALGSSGTSGGDAGGSAIIPFAYWSYSATKDLSVGLGISPTFGNTTEYSQDFIGRYSGYFAELKVINVNPSVSFKLNDSLVIGGGLNFAKTDIEFRQIAPVTALSSGAVTPDRDVRLKGDDTGWGYNLGALFKLSDASRVGVTYRSKIKFTLEGKQTVSGAAIPAAGPLIPLAAALPPSVAIKADLELPASFSVAFSHDLSKQWQILADYTWTGWSSIKKIDVIRPDGVPHPGLSYNFDDSYRVGLGVNYLMNEALKLRVGVAIDRTPVQSPADTTMTLPDSDRTWLSIGAKYTLSKANSIDVGYSHIFFKEATTARTVTSGATTLQTIRGTFDTSADYLSFQYNHNF